mmetsp:Transcript_10589/g.32622  ORF Transcript_10589/g.32622 Transcript_10589/m.32622 type:complete len:236 (+) Transcript_10589:364-1071(+)
MSLCETLLRRRKPLEPAPRMTVPGGAMVSTTASRMTASETGRRYCWSTLKRRPTPSSRHMTVPSLVHVLLYGSLAMMRSADWSAGIWTGSSYLRQSATVRVMTNASHRPIFTATRAATTHPIATAWPCERQHSDPGRCEIASTGWPSVWPYTSTTASLFSLGSMSITWHFNSMVRRTTRSKKSGSASGPSWSSSILRSFRSWHSACFTISPMPSGKSQSSNVCRTSGSTTIFNGA